MKLMTHTWSDLGENVSHSASSVVLHAGGSVSAEVKLKQLWGKNMVWPWLRPAVETKRRGRENGISTCCKLPHPSVSPSLSVFSSAYRKHTNIHQTETLLQLQTHRWTNPQAGTEHRQCTQSFHNPRSQCFSTFLKYYFRLVVENTQNKASSLCLFIHIFPAWVSKAHWLTGVLK